MSFANLKRSSSNLEKLTKEIEKIAQGSEGVKEDARFWQPTVDKAGNGMAIIRFLSAPEVDGDDGLPWVRVFSHGLQGPGGWLIENCPTTLGQSCPVCDHNSVLWNSGVKANKEIVSKQKRRLNYISNILVISDPKKPENEGKVFLFKYGKKIFDKLNDVMNPDTEAFPDEKPMNPFDFWTGANFKLKARKVEGYRNYDKSEFEKAAPVYSDDDEIEKLWKSEFGLKEFVDPKQFKSYEKIAERLKKVLGAAPQGAQTAEDDDASDNTPDIPAGEPAIHGDGDDDAELNYFKGLAK